MKKEKPGQKLSHRPVECCRAVSHDRKDGCHAEIPPRMTGHGQRLKNVPYTPNSVTRVQTKVTPNQTLSTFHRHSPHLEFPLCCEREYLNSKQMQPEKKRRKSDVLVLSPSVFGTELRGN